MAPCCQTQCATRVAAGGGGTIGCKHDEGTWRTKPSDASRESCLSPEPPRRGRMDAVRRTCSGHTLCAASSGQFAALLASWSSATSFLTWSIHELIRKDDPKLPRILTHAPSIQSASTLRRSRPGWRATGAVQCPSQCCGTGPHSEHQQTQAAPHSGRI